MSFKALCILSILNFYTATHTTQVVIAAINNATPQTLCVMLGSTELGRVDSSNTSLNGPITIPLEQHNTTIVNKQPLYIAAAPNLDVPLFTIEFKKEIASPTQAFVSIFLKAVDFQTQTSWNQLVTNGADTNDIYTITLGFDTDTTDRVIVNQGSIQVAISNSV